MTKLHFRTARLETPFHPRTSAACETNEWVNWAGYTTVNVYSQVEKEYFAVRNGTTLFDLSPMIKYRVRGAGATAFFNRLVTRDVTKLKPGRVAYVVWCDDAGHVLDDGTLFCFAQDDYRLCCQERQLDWLLDSAIGFEVSIEEESEEIAALAVQGPTSFSVLTAAGFTGLDSLRPFGIAESEGITVSRTGFTGDLGYELWMAPDQAVEVWDRIMAQRGNYDIQPIGSAALDLVRIEAGFIATNLDFVSAEQALRHTRGRSPFELGLGRLVDFEKGHFNGRRALLAERQAGAKYLLVGLDIEGNKPADGSLVYLRQRKEVGHITSAMWSPTCKRNLALAMLRRPYGDSITKDLWTEIYVLKELKYDRQMARCHVVERPFFNPPRRTATPPLPY
ncbi:MAG: aminomethyltransferase family protein [Pseudomonadota bacterium]